MSDQTMFYLFIFGVSVLFCVMALVIYSYRRLIIKIYKLGEYRKKIDEAQIESENIIKSAQIKASEIINKSGSISSEIDRSFEKLFREAIEKTMKRSDLEMSQAVTKFENDLIGELSNFKSLINQEMGKVLTQMNQATFKQLQDFEDMKKIYIEKIIKELKEKMPLIISDVSKNILERSLDINDHTEIINESLDQLKTEL